MKTKVKLLSVGFLAISSLIMMIGIAGCSSNCPPKGKWKTNESVGLIGFEVAKCKIQFIAVAVDLNSAGNRYGSLFAQEYTEKYGKIQTFLFPLDECMFESDGQFSCQKESTLLTGKFISEREAQGELRLPRGLELGNGFSLEPSNGLSFEIVYKWSATLAK